MLFMFCATVKTVGVFDQYSEGNKGLLLSDGVLFVE